MSPPSATPPFPEPCLLGLAVWAVTLLGGAALGVGVVALGYRWAARTVQPLTGP